MAIVLQKINATYTFLDTGGEKVARTFQVSAVDVAVAVAKINNALATIQAMTKSTILTVEMSVIYVNNTAVVPAAADNRQVLLVSGTLKNRPTKRGWVSIPAPIPQLFTGMTGEAANIMKWPDALINDFVKSFEAIADGGYDLFKLSDGETWTELDIIGKRTTRP